MQHLKKKIIGQTIVSIHSMFVSGFSLLSLSRLYYLSIHRKVRAHNTELIVDYMTIGICMCIIPYISVGRKMEMLWPNIGTGST